jgi:hypothetical protein
MLVYGVSCTAVAGLLYLCIERPFMMLRDRLDGCQVKMASRFSRSAAERIERRGMHILSCGGGRLYGMTQNYSFQP